jgi:hypothetical protein
MAMTIVKQNFSVCKRTIDGELLFICEADDEERARHIVGTFNDGFGFNRYNVGKSEQYIVCPNVVYRVED